jgi:hypothetical protein
VISSRIALTENIAAFTSQQLDIVRSIIGEMKLRVRQDYRRDLHRYFCGDLNAASTCFEKLRPLNVRLDQINAEDARRRGVKLNA